MAPRDNSVEAAFEALLRQYFPRDWITVREELRQATVHK